MPVLYAGPQQCANLLLMLGYIIFDRLVHGRRYALRLVMDICSPRVPYDGLLPKVHTPATKSHQLTSKSLQTCSFHHLFFGLLQACYVADTGHDSLCPIEDEFGPDKRCAVTVARFGNDGPTSRVGGYFGELSNPINKSRPIFLRAQVGDRHCLQSLRIKSKPRLSRWVGRKNFERIDRK